jgi:homoserine kinase type II
MSVFTVVTKPELEAYLTQYSVGELQDFHGIAAGIENTNYFVNTNQASYVLTLFEKTTPVELDYFLALSNYLSARDAPCARPIARRDANYQSKLNGKPATLVSRLPGKSIDIPQANHCTAIGAALARLHISGKGFQRRRANQTDVHWVNSRADNLGDQLTVAERALLHEIRKLPDLWSTDTLPGGVIHADLFRDNALFDGNAVSGIIDFYFACDGPLIYDLAIVIADWCFMPHRRLDSEGAGRVLRAYHSVRPLSSAERQMWPAALAQASRRFWLSRLEDRSFPRQAHLTFVKDPLPFKQLATLACHTPEQLLEFWP